MWDDFGPFIRKKSSSTRYLQCEKKPGDVWNMCTGTQNCARKSLPRAVNFATCSCWPELFVASARPFTTCGLGPTFHPRYARHTVEEALWTAACRIYAPAHADRNARCLAPSFQLRCWHCRSRSLLFPVYVFVMLASYSHYATRSAWPFTHAALFTLYRTGSLFCPLPYITPLLWPVAMLADWTQSLFCLVPYLTPCWCRPQRWRDFLRPCLCTSQCSLISLAFCSASCRILPLAHADRNFGPQ